MTTPAVEGVAVFRPIGAVDLDFADDAEIAEHGERHVFQRELDELALAGRAPVTLGGEDPQSRLLSGNAVPGGQHVPYRLARALWPGRHREPDRRIDRVVDLRAPVPVARDRHHDQVFAMLLKLVVVHPAAHAKVREEDARLFARRADEPGHDLLAARCRHVDRDAAFALVEAFPEQAAPALGHRPPLVVEPADEAIEADDVGAHLRKRHPREWGGDERRAFHDSQPFENLDHPSLPEFCQSSFMQRMCLSAVTTDGNSAK